VRAGDEEAAQQLVERLLPKVRKLVACHLPRRTSREDLAQTVFLKIFKNLHQFSGLVPLEHWVSRIAINTCLNEMKLERNRPELRMADFCQEEQAVIEQLNPVHADPAGEWDTEEVDTLRQLIPRLKPEERLVVQLLHLEGRSTREISRMTGWSISSIKVKAYRARNRLRTLWRQCFQNAAVALAGRAY
jgi:RNA polymerase sigma-70 factor (ECF subfamily)